MWNGCDIYFCSLHDDHCRKTALVAATCPPNCASLSNFGDRSDPKRLRCSALPPSQPNPPAFGFGARSSNRHENLRSRRTPGVQSWLGISCLPTRTVYTADIASSLTGLHWLRWKLARSHQPGGHAPRCRWWVDRAAPVQKLPRPR